MPTQDELAGLYDGSVKGHNGCKLTTLITLTNCCPWASEVRHDEGARFNFRGGVRYWGTQEGYHNNFTLRALPVRSAK